MYRVEWATEIHNFNLLKQQYKDISINIDFDDLCNQQQFLVQIDKINFTLDLHLDMDLVAQLWKSWHTASEHIWHK
jgi:hypothetical protein